MRASTHSVAEEQRGANEDATVTMQDRETMHNWLNVTHSIQTIWPTQLKNHYTVIMIIVYGVHRVSGRSTESDSSLGCSIGRRPILFFSRFLAFCLAAHGDATTVCVCVSHMHLLRRVHS